MSGLSGKSPWSALHQDTGGLIWGYRLADSEPIALDGMAAASEREPVWLHFNLSDGRARKWLTEHAELPPAALALLLDLSPRVRLQLLGQAVVATIEDLHHDFHGDPEGFGELRFYMDERRVISARRHPLRTVDVLHRSMEQGLTIGSTNRWLERMVEGLSDTFGQVVSSLVDQVDELEDEIVAGTNKDQRATLAGLRRLLVRFRRHLHADRGALAHLRSHAAHDPAQVNPLRQALEHLDGVSSDLDLIHERVRLLQEEVAGLLAEATNRNLYVLSIVTTALLPATLMTGVWGMNVGGLPWADDSHGILWSGLSVLASILLSLALLRGSRVL
jgi:zinc transporter